LVFVYAGTVPETHWVDNSPIMSAVASIINILDKVANSPLGMLHGFALPGAHLFIL